MKTIASLFVLCGVTAVWIIAQTGVPVEPTNTAPSGACPNPAMQYVSPGGTIYTCQNGTWAQASGGGGTPGGSNADIQYQKASAFAGSSNLIYYDTALAQPGNPTLSTHGTAGSASYTYVVVANGQLGFSVPSNAVTIATGNATLGSGGGNNYNIVTTVAVTNSTSCDVFQFTAVELPYGVYRYVGNVTCGSAINNTGTYSLSKPASGSQPGQPSDASAGVEASQNLLVTGLAAFGNIATLGGLPQINDSSAGSSVFIGQNVTGLASGFAESDPTALSIYQTINPAASGTLSGPSQTWGINLAQVIPSGVTYGTGQTLGIAANITDNGSGASTGLFAIDANTSMQGSVVGCQSFPGIPCNVAVSGTASADSSGEDYGTEAGVFGTSYSSGTGLQTEQDSILAKGSYVGSGATSTLLTGVHITAPSNFGTVTTYAGLQIEDGSAVGSTSYGLHVVGSSVISQFDGALQLPGLASATGTPNSLCINSNSVTVNAALTCTVSSARFKTRMKPIRSATTLLMRIVPESFAYRDDPQRTRLGFIAEQVASVDKKLGDGFDADGPRSIDQNAILALAVKTIQEQQAEIANLKRRITKLETEQK